MKLAQLLTPNLSAAAMDRAMGYALAKADPAPATGGNLFAPPADDGDVDGGGRSPERRQKVRAAAGAAGLAALLIGGVVLARRAKA